MGYMPCVRITVILRAAEVMTFGGRHWSNGTSNVSRQAVSAKPTFFLIGGRSFSSEPDCQGVSTL